MSLIKVNITSFRFLTYAIIVTNVIIFLAGFHNTDFFIVGAFWMIITAMFIQLEFNIIKFKEKKYD